jgi:hypothetical protein
MLLYLDCSKDSIIIKLFIILFVYSSYIRQVKEISYGFIVFFFAVGFRKDLGESWLEKYTELLLLRSV